MKNKNTLWLVRQLRVCERSVPGFPLHFCDLETASPSIMLEISNPQDRSNDIRSQGYLPQALQFQEGYCFLKKWLNGQYPLPHCSLKPVTGKTVITSVLGIRFFSLSGMNQSQFSLACLSLVLLSRKVTWH